MKPDLDPDALEKAAKAVAQGKWECNKSRAMVIKCVRDHPRCHCRIDAERAIKTYRDAIGLSTAAQTLEQLREDAALVADPPGVNPAWPDVQAYRVARKDAAAAIRLMPLPTDGDRIAKVEIIGKANRP